MARSVGNQIPEEIRALFSGEGLATREGLTFLFLTTTADGWPHLAMLSVGELLAVGSRGLRAALWPTSTATANLTRTGQATIALVHDGIGYSLRCSARRGPDLDLEREGQLAFFELQVEDALEDAVGYATLTSGLTYRLNEPGKVLPRWQATVAALRAKTSGRVIKEN